MRTITQNTAFAAGVALTCRHTAGTRGLPRASNASSIRGRMPPQMAFQAPWHTRRSVLRQARRALTIASTTVRRAGGPLAEGPSLTGQKRTTTAMKRTHVGR